MITTTSSSSSFSINHHKPPWHPLELPFPKLLDTKFAKPSILGKPVLQPPRNQSVVRQPNAFKSERPNFSKPWFDTQVDVNNVLSKPVTPYYLPKVRESAPVKPHHVNAPSSSRNSQKELYGSNDMAHNYYLEEAKKKMLPIKIHITRDMIRRSGRIEQMFSHII
ncbi:hypothetical protein Tco_0088423 [Tanacetum coccineum]